MRWRLIVAAMVPTLILLAACSDDAPTQSLGSDHAWLRAGIPQGWRYCPNSDWAYLELGGNADCAKMIYPKPYALVETIGANSPDAKEDCTQSGHALADSAPAAVRRHLAGLGAKEVRSSGPTFLGRGFSIEVCVGPIRWSTETDKNLTGVVGLSYFATSRATFDQHLNAYWAALETFELGDMSKRGI